MSTPKTYAVVEDGVVMNIILWNGTSEWSPPDGSEAHLLPDGSQVGIGWTTSDGVNYAMPPEMSAVSAGA